MEEKRSLRTAAAMAAVTLTLLLCACGAGNQQSQRMQEETEEQGPSPEKESGRTPDIKTGLEEDGLAWKPAKEPILLTCGGQTVDYQIAAAMLRKNDLDFSMDHLVEPEDLQGIHTVVMVAGGSLKGLRAAGLTVEDEKKRVERILKAAEEREIYILAMHIGGEARRGELSDPFIEQVFAEADGGIIVEGGDKDHQIRDMAKTGEIPLKVRQTIREATVLLLSLFER